jgi:hypothetical protein
MPGLHEAARELGVHPLNFLLRLYPLVGSLDECWPDVDQGYLDTARAIWPSRRVSTPPIQPKPEERVARDQRQIPLGLSRGAARVIEKLWRKDRWGDLGVAYASLRHMCQDVQDLDDAIEEVLEANLLPTETKKGPFSLNPSRKGDIEAVANAIIEGRSST